MKNYTSNWVRVEVGHVVRIDAHSNRRRVGVVVWAASGISLVKVKVGKYIESVTPGQCTIVK